MPRPTPPRPLTAASLEKSALWHLERRALTERGLRDALWRKAKRAAREHGDEPRAAEWIDAVVDKVKRLGFVDDERTAAAKATSLRARGASARAIAQKLRHKGVPADISEQAVRAVNDGDDELHAAREVVRRKKLRARDRQKALAALGRLGFRYDVARRALEDDERDDERARA